MSGTKRIVLLVFLSMAFISGQVSSGADSPAKATKSPATQRVAQKDPGEWNKLLEAAKNEGKLVLASDPSELYRKVLVTSFNKKYPEIKVEYTGINGRDFKPRLQQERKVGQYLWDVRVSGINPNTYEMKDTVFFDPLRSFVLP